MRTTTAASTTLENAKLLQIKGVARRTRPCARTMLVFFKTGNCQEGHSTSGNPSIPRMDITTLIHLDTFNYVFHFICYGKTSLGQQIVPMVSHWNGCQATRQANTTIFQEWKLSGYFHEYNQKYRYLFAGSFCLAFQCTKTSF